MILFSLSQESFQNKIEKMTMQEENCDESHPAFFHFHTTPAHSDGSAVISMVTQIEKKPCILCITRSCGSVDRIAITEAAFQKLQDMIIAYEVTDGEGVVFPNLLLLKRCKENRAMLECILGLTIFSAERIRPTRRCQTALATSQTPLWATGQQRPSSSIPPAHLSPEEWGSETVSALNARKKYSPYERPSSANGTLDSVTSNRMVHRLYNVALNTKVKNRGDILEKFLRRHGDTDRRILSFSEQQDLGDRLYYKQRAHTQQVTTHLKHLYCPERTPARQLTREDREEQGKRLYYNTLTRSKAAKAQLMKKYVESTEVKSVKLNPTQISNMANRLSTYKKE